MNEKLNLRRARIAELKHRLDDWETVALRHELGGGWELAGDNKRWTDDELHATFKASQVLAEFELTLADLIPGDCQAFRFKNNGLTGTAVFDMVYKTWEVTGHDGDFATLDSLAEHFDIELDTVVPLTLTTHSDYVEERR